VTIPEHEQPFDDETGMWRSWLAHQEIGRRVRAGEVAVPEFMTNTRDKAGAESRVVAQRSAPVYERHAFDWYVEGPEVVDKLFDAVRFDGPIHDPACGAGNIPRVAAARGIAATGSDLVDRGYGTGGVDFLDDTTPRTNIVSNPPYVLAERFALHALTVTSGRVALLVRLAFLEGQARRKRLFLAHPPERVLVLSTRPSMPPGDLAIQAKGGKVAYAWVIWNRSALPLQPTAIGWLP